MAASAPTAVPALVPYSGFALSEDGKSLEPKSQISFLIFKDEEGGEALWMETQSVQVDPTGHYKVQLGAANPQGLPMELFSTGEARWLEVQVAGEKPQPRVLLASVPYALKAGDATTLGGLPVSAFALADKNPAPAVSGASTSPVSAASTGVTTPGGTAGYIPEFDAASDITDSPLFISSGKVGIGELSPAAKLDVGGSVNVRGTLTLPKLASATTSAGSRSQLLQLSSSAWSTTTNGAVSPTFNLLANPLGNDTSSPSGALLFQYQQGSTASTVLSIASTGVISFAPTQTFPGTIGSVIAASPLSALTLNGSTSLGLNTAALETTLNTVYPQLGAANTFSASQAITGNLSVSSTLSGANSTMSGTSTAAGGFLSNGPVTLTPLNVATSRAGVNSPAVELTASSYSSDSASAQAQNFAWQAQPLLNDNPLPSGQLAFLSSKGSNALAPTGLAIAPSGQITFASGQTFPGAGAGTITGVTAGSGLLGGGTSGAVTLSANPNVVAELANNDIFTASVTVNGDFASNTSVNAPIYYLSSKPFLSAGASGSNNAFLGGGGNQATTGTSTTAVGFQALAAQTSGAENTSVGLNSLYSNTTGSSNTAVGAGALYDNVSGSENTALGLDAGAYNGASYTNTTALGYNSIVQQNNSLVLGNVTGNPGAEFVNVGIGTATPISALEISVGAPGALGGVITLTNPSGDTASAYGASAVDFNTQPVQGRNYNPGARIEALDDGQYSDALVFMSNLPGAINQGLQSNMVIHSNGQVAVGPGVSPTAQFTTTAIVGVSAVVANGGNSDERTGHDVASGDGVVGYGGNSANSYTGGVGGKFYGGSNSGTSNAGDGVYAIGGTVNSTSADGGFGGWFEGGANGNSSGLGGVGLVAEGGCTEDGNTCNLSNSAANFYGNVSISGTITATAKNFTIDHPLDPANKYLVHSSIESDEMVNIYSGNVTTDNLGVAVVHLPDWFEAENGDFRYQLTVIGPRFAQAIVSTEIHDHQFTISTNATNVKVSWQVTGVRQDAYAKAHPLVVERAKDDHERGFYLHPELFGQPVEKGMIYGRQPAEMQRKMARRTAATEERETASSVSPIKAQAGAPASAVNRKPSAPRGPATMNRAFKATKAAAVIAKPKS